MDIVEKARIFATAAHAAIDHRRKYTNEPYIVHPKQVAQFVETAGGTPEMIAAAWMHDVLEDTGVTPDVMRAEFGDAVTDLVLWVTDVSKKEDGNRATRKAIDRQHIAAAPGEAHTIKLADIISNCSSIMMHDAEFAKVYFEEKRLLLEVLTKGNEGLYNYAERLVLNED
jgi:(p)ppGpp synthase/HD superfamily hydrolase